MKQTNTSHSRKDAFPDYVLQYKTKGHVIKRTNSGYYLYKRTSKRIPGKKNPVPVDKYVGTITEHGLVINNVIKISMDAIEVHEYGFSKIVTALCPESWKKLLGDQWSNVLNTIIIKASPLSFLTRSVTLPDEKTLRCNLGAQTGRLYARIKEEYGITKEEIDSLKTIFLVTVDGRDFVSSIKAEQQAILDKAHISLEVC